MFVARSKLIKPLVDGTQIKKEKTYNSIGYNLLRSIDPIRWTPKEIRDALVGPIYKK